jgi:hypothetical protein
MQIDYTNPSILNLDNGVIIFTLRPFYPRGKGSQFIMISWIPELFWTLSTANYLPCP